jgi:hypothetical protein
MTLNLACLRIQQTVSNVNQEVLESAEGAMKAAAAVNEQDRAKAGGKNRVSFCVVCASNQNRIQFPPR